MSGDNFWIITDWNLPEPPKDKWELGDITFHDDLYPSSYGIGIISGDSVKVVCLVAPSDNVTESDRLNAALLLQAPKMLHMLEVIVDGLRHKADTDEWDVRLSPFCKQLIDDLIAKAKGATL